MHLALQQKGWSGIPDNLPPSFPHPDFRPAYLEISSLREAFPSVPIIAVTATATQHVQDQIKGTEGWKLGSHISMRIHTGGCLAGKVHRHVLYTLVSEALRMKDPVVLRGSFNRPNM